MVTQQSGWCWDLNHGQGDPQHVQTIPLSVCFPYNPDTECLYHLPFAPRVTAGEKARQNVNPGRLLWS